MSFTALCCAVLCFVLHCPLVLTYSVAQVEHNSKLRRDHQGKALESTPLFPAIQLIHDPQALAERLFKKLRQPGEKFEVKLLLMNFISRLIGCHKLVLLSFYSFLQRYITSHQKDVTHILAYLIQVLSTSTNTHMSSRAIHRITSSRLLIATLMPLTLCGFTPQLRLQQIVLQHCVVERPSLISSPPLPSLTLISTISVPSSIVPRAATT
jgi:hypothetical protein